jgi:serine/threonine protein kinase
MLSVLDHLIDNGNFSRYFSEISTISEEPGEKLILAEHKLDSQKYLVLVQDFDFFHEKLENAVLAQVNKFRSLKCRGLTRYVTCWVEEGCGNLQLFVQLEKVEGQKMAEFVENGIKPNEAVKVVGKVAKVLKFLHKKGLAYGNLDLENLFMDEFGNVCLGMPRLCGKVDDDLDMFRKMWTELLAHVHKDQVELAEKMFLEDRLVGQLDIYQIN